MYYLSKSLCVLHYVFCESNLSVLMSVSSGLFFCPSLLLVEEPNSSFSYYIRNFFDLLVLVNRSSYFLRLNTSFWVSNCSPIFADFFFLRFYPFCFFRFHGKQILWQRDYIFDYCIAVPDSGFLERFSYCTHLS